MCLPRSVFVHLHLGVAEVTGLWLNVQSGSPWLTHLLELYIISTCSKEQGKDPSPYALALRGELQVCRRGCREWLAFLRPCCADVGAPSQPAPVRVIRSQAEVSWCQFLFVLALPLVSSSGLSRVQGRRPHLLCQACRLATGTGVQASCRQGSCLPPERREGGRWPNPDVFKPACFRNNLIAHRRPLSQVPA